MDIEKRNEAFAAIAKAEERGNWKEVLSICLRLTELNLPDLERSIGWINAGRAHGHLKNINEALHCYDRAAELEKTHNRYFATEQKAAFLAEQGKYKDAAELYRQLMARKDLYLSDIQRFGANIEILEKAK